MWAAQGIGSNRPVGSHAGMSPELTTLLASGGNGGGGGGAIIQLGILLLIPFGMYFFLIRPQRRRMRDQQDLQRSISVGDEVVTTSGLYGRISGEDGEHRFWLEIDDDVQVRIARAAVQAKVVEDEDDDDEAPAEVGQDADSADGGDDSDDSDD